MLPPFSHGCRPLFRGFASNFGKCWVLRPLTRFFGQVVRARVLLKLIPLGRDSAGCYALLWFTACTCMACAIASWASGFFRFATRTGGLSGQELGSGQAGANPRQSLQGRVPGGVLLWGKASAHRRQPPTSQSHLPRCRRTWGAAVGTVFPGRTPPEPACAIAHRRPAF